MIDENNLYGVITFSGPDAKTFLQGQVTCDVTQLNPTHSIVGAYCNIQGRVIASFRLIEEDGLILMLLPVETVNLTIETFKKYAIFSKVEIKDSSDEYRCFGLSVIASKEAMKTLKIQEPKNNQHTPDGWTVDEVGRLIWCGVKKLAAGLRPDPIQNWRYENIQLGIAEIYQNTQEKFLPHPLNYQQRKLLNFDKGCYLGQEIIARMHYRAKLKNHLYHLNVEGTHRLQPGDKLYDVESDREIAQIVDAVCINDHTEILVIMEDKYASVTQMQTLEKQRLKNVKIRVYEELSG